ncbi:MAG: redoxin domain-containing protein [Actinomycetota bacterium]|nr:redoxin domain-containing protein [Actinomycetota bacterium]
MVQVGEQAPSFRAHSSQGHTLQSDVYLGRTPMVLFFFPEIGTPGCDAEISAFNARLKEFGQNRVQLLGITRARAKDLRHYAEEHNLKVPLLADESSKIIRDYGVAAEDGRARRVTVIVDRLGKVAHVFDPVETHNHAEEVLSVIDQLREERPEAMSRETG